LRVGAVRFANFPCLVEELREPTFRGLPVVIGGNEGQKHVLYASSSAQSSGIHPGIPLRRALSLCPSAVFLEDDPLRYRDAWDRLLDVLGNISPSVEDAGLGCSYLDLTGLSGHYAGDVELGEAILRAAENAFGASPAIGIAEGKFPAAAAALAGGVGLVTTIPKGREADFLAPLDVSLLPVRQELLDRLRLLALDVIGEVAFISLGDLISQFGPDGKRLWQLCNGADGEPLSPRTKREYVEAGMEMEAPVAGVEIIVACARRLLSRLLGPLRGRATREIFFRAELEEGRSWEKRVVLREAVSDSDRLAFVVKSTLNLFPPPRPVVAMSLRLANLASETGRQLSLDERSRDRDQLEETIRQLTARYGSSPIYQVVDAEAWSEIPEDRQVLVEYDA
jgi:DNA polymerase-4